MIGSIIGAGMQVAGSVVGGIAASRAAKKAGKMIAAQKKQNQAWYDRRYNEDATQRASAQSMISTVRNSIAQRNQQAAGNQAVMGGTDESVMAQQQQNNKAMSDTVSNIAAAGDARKDAIEQQYLNRDAELSQQQISIQQQKASSIGQAIQGVSGTGSAIAGNIK